MNIGSTYTPTPEVLHVRSAAELVDRLNRGMAPARFVFEILSDGITIRATNLTLKKSIEFQLPSYSGPITRLWDQVKGELERRKIWSSKTE